LYRKQEQTFRGENERAQAHRQDGPTDPKRLKFRRGPAAEQRGGQQHSDEDVAPGGASRFAGLLPEPLALSFRQVCFGQQLRMIQAGDERMGRGV
jgi:hypothetical protein